MFRILFTITLALTTTIMFGCDTAHMMVPPTAADPTEPEPTQPTIDYTAQDQSANPFKVIIDTINSAHNIISHNVEIIKRMDGGPEVLSIIMSNASDIEKVNQIWNLPPSEASNMVIDTVWEDPNKVRKLAHSIKDIQGYTLNPPPEWQ